MELITYLAIYFLTLIFIIKMVFNLPVSGIWATSGLIGLVIGFALRTTLTNIFSGIAINIDQPYKVDDWVRVQLRGIEEFIGRVKEITWRSTRIEKTDGVITTVPNSYLDMAVITNLSKPERKSRFELQFLLDFEIAPDRVLRILEAAVKSASAPLQIPRSKVKIDKVVQEGVIYRVYYWLDPVQVAPSTGRHIVSRSILIHLHKAGLSLARVQQDVYYEKMPSRNLDVHFDILEILNRIEIFRMFGKKDLEKLSKKLSRIKLPAQIEVVKSEDPGESMFIILEGLLAVYIGNEQGKSVQLNQLEPGEFFGEMSLLTGEPRSATVVCVTDAVIFEISKDDIMEFLQKKPEVAKQMTEIIANRRINQQKHSLRANDEESIDEEKNMADQIFKKMIRFIGLKFIKKK